MSKLSADAQVTSDFNQLNGTINNAETGKITELRVQALKILALGSL